MIRILFDVDTRSLLIVLFAFTGNAQIYGVDISLALIAPLLLVLHIGRNLRIKRKSLAILLVSLIFLGLASARSFQLNIPYNESYWVWPLKAMFLMLVAACSQELRWPPGNMVALFFACLLLAVVGKFEDGRLYSVFGPNMLYRVFGFLLVFSILPSLGNNVFNRRTSHRFIGYICALLGVLWLFLTGSSGALLLLAIVAVIVALRLSKLMTVLLILGAGIGLVSSALFTDVVTSNGDAPVIIHRFLYKLAAIETNTRLLGWTDLLSRPFSAFGHDYGEFYNLWFYGYLYPHNIVVELYAFYGVIGIFFIYVVIRALVLSVPLLILGDVAALTLLVIFIGSLFSGDLSDNYGPIGLSYFLLFKHSSKKFTRTRPELKKR